LEIFACEQEEFVGKAPKDLSPEKQPDGKDSQDKILKLTTKAYRGEPQFFEWQCRRPDNTFFPAEVSLTRIVVDDGYLLQVIMRDISDRKQAEETIYHMAYHDALTGLVNRHEFERRLSHVLKSAKRRNTDNAILYIDLDKFKIVNDSCGHAAGDALLKQVAARLREPVRERDTVARLGGDEFGILLENCPSSSAMEIANNIVKLVREIRFVWKDKIFSVGASVGVAAINNTSHAVDEVLKAADMACYMSKELGRNRVHMFKSDDENFMQRKAEMSLVAQVNEALEHDKFVLYHQPIVSLNHRNSNQQFFEIFVRMINSAGEIIPAADFVIASELYNQMPAIDRWVIRNAFSYITEMSKKNPENRDTVFFINLSGTSFNDESFLEFVQEELCKVQFSADRICFEVTETAAIANITLAQKFIHAVKSLGCCFALDDFGSGLSSFTYLKELPVDYLKIDGTFVCDIVDDHKDYSIVEAIAQIGHSMGMQTIAESVENDRIVEKLKELDVDYAQGYGIKRPTQIRA
jgi:diguanylate cyclase (GGDEF)-like protein